MANVTSINTELPSINSGDENKIVSVNDDSSGYELTDEIKLNNIEFTTSTSIYGAKFQSMQIINQSNGIQEGTIFANQRYRDTGATKHNRMKLTRDGTLLIGKTLVDSGSVDTNLLLHVDGNVQFNNDLTCDNITASGNLSCVNITGSGNLSCVDITGSGNLSCNGITASGNITGSGNLDIGSNQINSGVIISNNTISCINGLTAGSIVNQGSLTTQAISVKGSGGVEYIIPNSSGNQYEVLKYTSAGSNLAWGLIDDNSISSSANISSSKIIFSSFHVRGTLSISNLSDQPYYTLPSAAGTAGQVLQYPSSGTTLEWATPSSSSSQTFTYLGQYFQDSGNVQDLNAANKTPFQYGGSNVNTTYLSHTANSEFWTLKVAGTYTISFRMISTDGQTNNRIHYDVYLGLDPVSNANYGFGPGDDPEIRYYLNTYYYRDDNNAIDDTHLQGTITKYFHANDVISIYAKRIYNENTGSINTTPSESYIQFEHLG
jgi:hypothetical protein